MEILYFAILALIIIVFLLQIQINNLKSENKQLHEYVNGYFEKQININENIYKAIYILSGSNKED